MLAVLVFCLVRPPCLRLENMRVIHRKEKVYGSIP